MPTRQERRENERVTSTLVCPFEVTKFMGNRTVKWTKGSGHAVNKSVRGLLLLLPVPVNTRQVVEIQIPSKAKKKPSTTLWWKCVGPAPFQSVPESRCTWQAVVSCLNFLLLVSRHRLISRLRDCSGSLLLRHNLVLDPLIGGAWKNLLLHEFILPHVRTPLDDLL